jgi:hypothetical protein
MKQIYIQERKYIMSKLLALAKKVNEKTEQVKYQAISAVVTVSTLATTTLVSASSTSNYAPIFDLIFTIIPIIAGGYGVFTGVPGLLSWGIGHSEKDAQQEKEGRNKVIGAVVAIAIAGAIVAAKESLKSMFGA